jgi:hypothetical protein
MERCSPWTRPFAVSAAVASLLLAAGGAGAQEIGGAITDSTGAALPGVLIEASSPSIIEGVRTVNSDGGGRYLIVALESGTYTVTYSLPGFGTFVREGVELTTGFTASIDVQLSVGDVQETVTVSGAGPIVDIQNTLQRQIIDREVIDSVPTGKDFRSYALLTPGMTTSNSFGTTLNQDAGGITAQTTAALSIHGGRGRDGMTALNGMDVSNAFSAGAGQMFGLVSDGAVEEMSIEVAGHDAEAQYGGVTVNLIPREGANQFSGGFFGTFTGAGLQGDNLSSDLAARGVTNFPQVDEVWLINPSVGGPLVEDRLWFFAQHTSQRGNVQNPGVFAATNAAAPFYTPDTSSPVVSVNENTETSFNFTWQASSKDKFNVYYSNANWKKPNALAGPFRTFIIAPEASINRVFSVNTTQISWVRPATNRLLFEAGSSFAPGVAKDLPNANAALDVYSLFEIATRTIHRNSHFLAQGTGYTSNRATNSFYGSASYVTGTHNLKIGFNGSTFQEMIPDNFSQQNYTDAVAIMGLPLQAGFTIPNLSDNQGIAWGFYAQDQMTFDRLTVNAGLRFDHLGNSYPDQTRAASVWEPAGLTVQGNDSVVNWNDLNPRLGVVYDVTGNGKTALKASFNRYGTRSNSEWAVLLNPASSTPLRQSARVWLDGAAGHPFAGIPAVFPGCIPSASDPTGSSCIAGDGLVQGDPTNPAPNGELIFPASNLAWGSSAQVQFVDPNWASGWGNRFSNWEMTAGIQQELASNVSVEATIYRRAFVNHFATDDRSLSGSDFDYATIDLSGRGIPGVGTVTIPEIKPDAIRVPDVLFTGADQFGGETQTYNGVDFTTNVRLDNLLLQGGLSTGTISNNFCGLYDTVPEDLRRRGQALVATYTTTAREFCSTSTPWLTQFKLLANYTMPGDVQIAATLQSASGPERRADITISLAEVAAALGRPSATGIAPQINALAPGSDYGERFNQFDLRFTKIFSMDSTRLRAMFDIYNVFNANAVTSEIYATGPSYLSVSGFMPPRLLRFAIQADF